MKHNVKDIAKLMVAFQKSMDKIMREKKFDLNEKHHFILDVTVNIAINSILAVAIENKQGEIGATQWRKYVNQLCKHYIAKYFGGLKNEAKS